MLIRIQRGNVTAVSAGFLFRRRGGWVVKGGEYNTSRISRRALQGNPERGPPRRNPHAIKHLEIDPDSNYPPGHLTEHSVNPTLIPPLFPLHPLPRRSTPSHRPHSVANFLLTSFPPGRSAFLNSRKFLENSKKKGGRKERARRSGAGSARARAGFKRIRISLFRTPLARNVHLKIHQAGRSFNFIGRESAQKTNAGGGKIRPPPAKLHLLLHFPSELRSFPDFDVV